MITLVVENGQREIKMEQTWIDQLETDHLAACQRDKLPMSLQGRAKAIAGENSPRQNCEIALRLVDGAGFWHVSGAVQDAVATMPLCMRGNLSLAFLVGKLGQQSVAVYYGCAVCGKDHVWQAGQRVQQVDSVACRAVGLHQPRPLADGQRTVHLNTRIHPWIDRINHVEVGRWTHQIVPKPGTPHGVPNPVQHSRCHP